MRLPESRRILHERLTRSRPGRILLHLFALLLEPLLTAKRCGRHLAGIARELAPSKRTLKMLSVFLQIATTERPALVGWLGGGTGIATMNLQRAHEWVSLTAGVLGCIATVAAIVYTSVRCYYIIKKGRSD